MPLLRVLLSVLASFALVIGACGDDDDDSADPTPEAIGEDDTNATVPRDDGGAIGEDVPDDRPIADGGEDEDSQTDTPAPGDDEVVPRSNNARVIGDFAGEGIDLLLTEDAECIIEETPDAGGETDAVVRGATADGQRFTFDWSVDLGSLESTLELDGTTWTVDVDTDEQNEADVTLTRNGEVFFEAEYTANGEEADAQLYVNCQPVQ